MEPRPSTTTDPYTTRSRSGVRSDALLLTDPYPVGTTTITWSVNDIHGNPGSAIQTIIVTGHNSTVVIAPADITYTTNDGGCSYTGNPGTATATDHCGLGTP